MSDLKQSTSEIPSKEALELEPRQILSIAIPTLLIYLIIGMPSIGNKVMSALGFSGTELDILQYIYHFLAAFVFLFVIPVIIIKWRYPKVSFGQFGCQKGNLRLGLILMAIGLIAIPVIYIGSTDPALQEEYPLTKSVLNPLSLFILYECMYGLFYYVAYEFHFRGLWQLGLSKKWGKWVGIWIVTIITAFIHWIPMDKPLSEILSAFAVGILFGYLAEKTQSWYYIFAIHFFVGILSDTFCGLRFLGIL